MIFKNNKKINLSDIAIMTGLALFSYGVAAKYSVPDMCMISGCLVFLIGLFFARAAAKKRPS